MVQAASFEYKAEEDKLYIYEITQFDEDVLEDLYVTDYELEDILGKDAEVGAMYCVMITDVDETESGGKDGIGIIIGWDGRMMRVILRIQMILIYMSSMI
jgi:hypothetical protein